MKKYILIILLIVIIGLLIVSYILNINIFLNNKIMENNLIQSVSASEYKPEELQDNQNKELFEEYYDKAEELMNSMTLEEKMLAG